MFLRMIYFPGRNRGKAQHHSTTLPASRRSCLILPLVKPASVSHIPQRSPSITGPGIGTGTSMNEQLGGINDAYIWNTEKYSMQRRHSQLVSAVNVDSVDKQPFY